MMQNYIVCELGYSWTATASSAIEDFGRIVVDYEYDYYSCFILFFLFSYLILKT